MRWAYYRSFRIAGNELASLNLKWQIGLRIRESFCAREVSGWIILIVFCKGLSICISLWAAPHWKTRCDALRGAQLASEAGMRAIVLRARIFVPRLLRMLWARSYEFSGFGAICLNSDVGVWILRLWKLRRNWGKNYLDPDHQFQLPDQGKNLFEGWDWYPRR